MPIVNGSYVTQPLGTPKDVQNQVFGGYTRKDMSDFTQAAYNYQMQQQQQAFELEMWNLKNQYDSPESQMARYQQAGLNPNLIYGQQNVSGNVPQGSPANFRSTGTYSRNLQQGMNMISQVLNTVKAARETYDYITYGRETSAWQRNIAMNQAEAGSLANRWNRWLLGLEPDDSISPDAPKRLSWQMQYESNVQAYNKLVAMVGLIQDQRARTQALKYLDDYRLSILKGQHDAILNIQTGNGTLDAWLRAFYYIALSKI